MRRRASASRACALTVGFVALATISALDFAPAFAPAFAQGATLSERVESLEGALEGLRAEGADADGPLALQRRLNTVEAELGRINSRGGTTGAPAPAAVSPELLRRLGAVEAELGAINARGDTIGAPAPDVSPELLRRLGAVEAELRVINARGDTIGAPAPDVSPELLRRLGAVEAELRVINARGDTIAAPPATPAAASPELLRRLGAVEAELRVINASGGTTAAAPATPAAPSPELLRRLGAVEAELRVINAQEEPTATPLALQRRLGSLEGELREITGSVEGLEFRSRQLEARLAELEAAPPAPTAPTAGESAGEPAPLLAPEGDGTVRVLGTVPESALGLAAPVAPVAPPPRTAAATPREQYNRALALLRQKNYDEAELEFQLFLDTWPDDVLGENAAYWLGETFYVRRRYDEALRIFAASLDDAPAGSKAPDSLLKLGLSLRSLGEAADACAAFQALNDRYADAPESILLRARKELESPDCL